MHMHVQDILTENWVTSDAAELLLLLHKLGIQKVENKYVLL
jgi:hypothetical protein